MPAKEIKELRQAGKLEDAYNMAKAELDAQPDNIWAKRNISWVLYDYLKANCSSEHFDAFLKCLKQIVALQLPGDEKMLFDNLCWQIGKMIFVLLKNEPVETNKILQLFEQSKSLEFTNPSEGYSFLFKALHKGLKDSEKYIEFADWWNLKSFRAEDFQKEKMPNGKEVMSVAERAYIAYAKHLLPIQTQIGEVIFNKEKAIEFMPLLDELIEAHPEFQFPAFYKAKLLLASGDKENMLSALIPFAKKKRNDFWVWDVLSEAFPDDEEKVIACYCKALSCRTTDDFLVSIRQRLAKYFVKNKMHPEAKTEIDLLVKARNENQWKIPIEVNEWIAQSWYSQAMLKKSNNDFYKKYFEVADNILYSDVPEESIIVDFVNSDKKILNFIASNNKFGFFKYERFINKVSIGDILKVRFNGGSKEGMFQIYSLSKAEDDQLRSQYTKKVDGIIRVPEGKSFGFVDDIFVHPSLVSANHLSNGQKVIGKAIKTFKKEKQQWGWKLFEVKTSDI